MSIRAVGGQLERRHRGEVDLARSGEPRAVPGERQPDPAGQPFAARSAAANPGTIPAPARAPTGRVVARAEALELARLGRPLEHLLAGDAPAQDLAGRRRVADAVDVAAPDLERADPERLGDAVEVGLGGELGLWRAEPAERAVGRRVGAAARARIRTFGQRYGPPAWIAPRDRTTGVSVQYAPPSITTSMSWAMSRPSRVTPGPVADDRRVALGRRREVLVAVVDHPDRSPGLARQQRRVQRDHRRVFLLAAEPAAGLRLDDARLAVVDGEAALAARYGCSTGTAASRGQ